MLEDTSVKLTTKQLKQIIKEELDLLQLPFEWASIKKEWESLKMNKFPEEARKMSGWQFRNIGFRERLLVFGYRDLKRTIEKYPQYFPPNKQRKLVRRWNSEETMSWYEDDPKGKPDEWTTEGVLNIWVRDHLDPVQKHINKIKNFYEQKIRPFQSALVHQLRDEMETGFDPFDRVVEDLMRIVNEFINMERPVFTWFAPPDWTRRSWWEPNPVEYYDTLRFSKELTVKNWAQRKSWGWDGESPQEVKLDISWIGKQLKGLRFAFKDTMDLIESWKRRIDREKTR